MYDSFHEPLPKGFRMCLAHGGGLYRFQNSLVTVMKTVMKYAGMKNVFNTDRGWKLARALAFLCSGIQAVKNCDGITDWISGDLDDLPDEHRKNKAAFAATLAAFRAAWPEFENATSTLHPVIWLWFGVDRVRSHLHPICLAQFVQYIEESLKNGYRPILRHHINTSASLYHLTPLVSDEGKVARVVLVATLPYRPFDKRVAEKSWRSHAQRNDVPRPRIKGQVQRAGKRSSESPNCIAVLTRLLDVAADRGDYVERLSTPQGTLIFKSLGLKRPQLIEALSTEFGGRLLRDFTDNTKLRAMSAVVRCKPGPAELALEAVGRRRKAR